MVPTAPVAATNPRSSSPLRRSDPREQSRGRKPAGRAASQHGATRRGVDERGEAGKRQSGESRYPAGRRQKTPRAHLSYSRQDAVVVLQKVSPARLRLPIDRHRRRLWNRPRTGRVLPFPRPARRLPGHAAGDVDLGRHHRARLRAGPHGPPLRLPHLPQRHPRPRLDRLRRAVRAFGAADRSRRRIGLGRVAPCAVGLAASARHAPDDRRRGAASLLGQQPDRASLFDLVVRALRRLPDHDRPGPARPKRDDLRNRRPARAQLELDPGRPALRRLQPGRAARDALRRAPHRDAPRGPLGRPAGRA